MFLMYFCKQELRIFREKVKYFSLLNIFPTEPQYFQADRSRSSIHNKNQLMYPYGDHFMN